MAQGFKATPRGYTAQFSATEAELLGKLFNDVATALTPDEQPEKDPLAALIGITENTDIPEDPAVARMLPVASDDPEVADEYRRYTELSLRQHKIGNLKLAHMQVQHQNITLNDEHAQAWASALNDVRLTLAERLNIHSEEQAEKIGEYTNNNTVETVEEYMSFVYNFITWLQDTLMEAMLSQLPDEN
ncbi:DUF2017 domain-containing protein [Rothia sp. CCM 9419]|uniref:DUF2017 domain-containing protein n=1 Tax=Rothia sp. CCM 9419 TaxID=3402662 RepID=UPI003AE3798F